jgi:hypothetical protein
MISPILINHIETLALFANSKAETLKGKVKAAKRYYAANRRKKVSYSKVQRRKKFSEVERENLRILNDSIYRKNWIAKVRRLLKKSTIYDVLNKKHDALITRVVSLKLRADYPEALKNQVTNIRAFSQNLAREIFSKSESYSGTNNFRYQFSPYVKVETQTSKGERYSSKCTYRKTDAFIKFDFTVDGIINLMKLSEEVRNQSKMDGLTLIAVSNIKSRTAECVWIKGSKNISSEYGAIAWDFFKNNCVIFHGRTVKSAKIGLDKKITKLAEHEENLQRLKSGLPPLWKPVIKLSDIRPLTGWCIPGIRQWIQNFMGCHKAVAEWQDVAKAALKDSSSYGQTLQRLLGIVPNGPYSF